MRKIVNVKLDDTGWRTIEIPSRTRIKTLIIRCRELNKTIQIKFPDSDDYLTLRPDPNNEYETGMLMRFTDWLGNISGLVKPKPLLSVRTDTPGITVEALML